MLAPSSPSRITLWISARTEAFGDGLLLVGRSPFDPTSIRRFQLVWKVAKPELAGRAGVMRPEAAAPLAGPAVRHRPSSQCRSMIS